MTGKIVTLPELCEILDVSPKSVRDMLISPTFPFHEKGHPGKPHQFDTAHVVNWLKDRERNRAAKGNPASDIAAAKTRSATAQAEAREFDIALKRGDFIPIASVAPILADELIEVRTIFAQIPPNAREQFGPEVARWIEGQHSAAWDRVAIAKQPLTQKEIEEYRNER